MISDQVEWWASLPRPVVVAAAALLTSVRGEWLMVKTNYRDGWQLPGGIVEAGESPRAGCIREVREEVGLDVEVGALRCVEYRSLTPGSAGPPTSLQFVFAGPVFDALPPLTLQAAEIEDAAWLAPDAALDVAIPHVRYRLGAVRALGPDGCAYLEDSAIPPSGNEPSPGTWSR